MPNKNWYMSEYRAGRTDTWKWAKTRGETAGIQSGSSESGFLLKVRDCQRLSMLFSGVIKERDFLVRPLLYDTDDIHESFDKVFEKLESEHPETKRLLQGKR